MTERLRRRKVEALRLAAELQKELAEAVAERNAVAARLREVEKERDGAILESDERAAKWREADEALEQAVSMANDLGGELVRAETRLREHEKALKWIADPSYIGNYEPLAVIEIYRKWARAALAACTCDHGTDPATLTTCNRCEGTGEVVDD